MVHLTSEWISDLKKNYTQPLFLSFFPRLRNRFVLMKLLFSVIWTMEIYVSVSEFIVKYQHQFNIPEYVPKSILWS
jgi:hypothetical protein